MGNTVFHVNVAIETEMSGEMPRHASFISTDVTQI